MGRAKTIVLVEDSEDLREIVAMLLRDLGYRVVECEAADEAFEAVRRERPDLLLTDIHLGVGNGLELIDRIRSDIVPPLPHFVACSGIPDSKTDALHHGVELFLPKPLEADVLRDAIVMILADRRVDATTIATADDIAKQARAAARRAAGAARARLEPVRGELQRRAEWGARWLATYLGFGVVTMLLIDGDELKMVTCSSGEQLSAEWLEAQKALANHVLETGSTLVLPDAASFGRSSRTRTTSVRFFAGVPLNIGVNTVGAVCVVDDRPRSLDVEDYQLLTAMGQRRSSVLSDQGKLDAAPFWERSGLLTGEAFDLVAALGLERARRLGAHVDILTFETEHPIERKTWMTGLAERISLERVALAERASDRYELLLMRATVEESRRDLTAAVRVLRERARITAGGVVSIHAEGLPPISEHDVVRLGESLSMRARRMGHNRIEGVVIGAISEAELRPLL